MKASPKDDPPDPPIVYGKLEFMNVFLDIGKTFILIELIKMYGNY